MRTDALDKLSRVVISPDGLQATIQLQPGLDPSDITTEAIEAVIVARGVKPSEATDTAAQTLARQMMEAPAETAVAVVAKGVPPEHGVDGRFELDPNLVERRHNACSNPDDLEFDHYSRSAFIIVDAGERLGRVLPHTEAQDGLDVRGKVIKAAIGRPCTMKFDDSVELQPDGSVIARRKGRLEHDASSLSIEAVLEVQESVDFSTGNVSFPGDVIIRKGVKDCFSIDAGGDLEIVELVEAATIHAKGTIVLRRGMAGRGKGQLHAGGDLEARYLDGVSIQVGNDIRIQRELSNCETKLGRTIDAPGCTLNGGNFLGRFGGRLRALGGEAEAETFVRIGFDPELEDKARLLDDLIPKVAKHLEKARQQLTDLQHGSTKLTPAQAENMTSLQFEIMTGEARMPAVRSAVEQVLNAFEQLHSATLTVEKVIMPGVTIAIGSQAAQIREPIRGPITIALDETGKLVLKSPVSGAVTPLASKAKIYRTPGALDMDELRRWLESPALKKPPQKAA